ncbi:MAG: Fic family protein [Elusimicrobiota bacterium]|jgi:Fic family protein|nr:Fic family protein [Elusimicrobiota bacterium]
MDNSNDYNPPYKVSEKTLSFVASISEKISLLQINQTNRVALDLRRNNRIKSINSSLAIENNSLSLEETRDIINGKAVAGPREEIVETKNALAAYEELPRLKSTSEKDLLRAHKLMTKDLVKTAGHYRSGGAGVFAGSQVVHTAPPANMVPQLMGNLFDWLAKTQAHPLIKSSIFHYEFVFIHPFADGNGRVARLWQTLILSEWREVFAWLPAESMIRKYQQDYYDAIAVANKSADITPFLEFMLKMIDETAAGERQIRDGNEKMSKLLSALGDSSRTRAELMKRLGLKNSANFLNEYLRPALDGGLIEMTLPDKPNSKNQEYKKKIAK